MTTRKVGYAEAFHTYLEWACPRGAGDRRAHQIKDLIHVAHPYWGIPTCMAGAVARAIDEVTYGVLAP